MNYKIVKESKIFTYKFNLILYFVLILINLNSAFAQCNFNTENKIKELSDKKFIQNINIKLDSKKFIKLNLAAINDRSQDNPNSVPRISEKYKKYFDAIVTINYDFGSCIYSSKIKLTGDQIDHLSFNESFFFPSLKISLSNGNILHNTEFKLFKPETRNNDNEIIGVNLIKELGFIAPDTFLVDVFINNQQTQYIFQEEINKNFLEKNQIRETLILKADQSLRFNPNYSTSDLADITSLIFKNDEIFLKNENFSYFGIIALSRMNESYFKFHQSSGFDKLLHNPNLEKSNIEYWDNFNLLMLALGAEHSIDILNRIVIYDILEDDFIPVYYDGNILLPNLEQFNPYENTLNQFLARVEKQEILKIIKKIQNLKNYNNSNELKNLEDIYLFFLAKKNLDLNCCDVFKEKDLIEINFKKFTNFREVKQNFIYFQSINNDLYKFKNQNQHIIDISNKDLNDVFNNVSLNDDRNIIIKPYTNYQFDTFKSLNNISFLEGKIFYGSNTEIKIDHEKKIIHIYTNNQQPNVLFYKNNFTENWTIIDNSNITKHHNSEFLKMNKYGFNGCINFYKVKFNHSSLISNNSVCEDAINIIKSSGKIDLIDINNSAMDALDIDFSDLNIFNINVINAGNDCLDVSWGTYKINEVVVNNCKDKGFSIGENSKVEVLNLTSTHSNIGIASKDSSISLINNFNGELNNLCNTHYNKKEEFFNSKLTITNSFCKAM